MSEGNGASESPILSLSEARRKPGRSSDWLTRKDAETMVAKAIADNIPQIHEFYLNQLPTFVARMIQDALLSYGLIKPIEGTDISLAPVSDTGGSTEPVGTAGGGDEVQGENGGLLVTE